VIILSQTIWESLLHNFQLPRAPLERVAYLDGVAFEDIQIATTITLPNAQMFPRYFRVSGDAMSEAGQHFRRYGLSRLAQVHTHPNGYTEHSPFDDENAYSQLDGAISIVMPHHARHRPGLADCTVHLRTPIGWEQLSAADSKHTIRIVPGCLDFRRLK